jgi:ribosomal protein S18 acetylase RimI-like enzyme
MLELRSTARAKQKVSLAMKVPEAIPLDARHFSQVADILKRAFDDYPLMQFAVPDARRRSGAVRSLYSSVLRYSMLYGQVHTMPDLTGAACWLPPDQPFPTFWRMVRIGMLSLPFRFGWQGFNRLQAADHVAEALHRTHAPGQHWYLWVIGVDPQHQGKGIAGQLMRPVFERADRDRFPCYLETHKDSNVRVYERYGFHVAEQKSVPGHPQTVWGMVRSPTPGQ